MAPRTLPSYDGAHNGAALPLPPLRPPQLPSHATLQVAAVAQPNAAPAPAFEPAAPASARTPASAPEPGPAPARAPAPSLRVSEEARHGLSKVRRAKDHGAVIRPCGTSSVQPGGGEGGGGRDDSSTFDCDATALDRH